MQCMASSVEWCIKQQTSQSVRLPPLTHTHHMTRHTHSLTMTAPQYEHTQQGQGSAAFRVRGTFAPPQVSSCPLYTFVKLIYHIHLRPPTFLKLSVCPPQPHCLYVAVKVITATHVMVCIKWRGLDSTGKAFF